MKHLRQTTRHNCGQACVAMLASCGIEVATAVIGKKGKTRTRDIIKGLRAFGIRCAEKRKRCSLKRALPDIGILFINFDSGKKGYGHWIVKHGDTYYDPADEGPSAGVRLVPGLWTRVTSFLEVYNAP